MRYKSSDENLIGLLKVVTLSPVIMGTLAAILVLVIQCWQWWQRGEWQKAPIADFLPLELVEWTVVKEGGVSGLRKLTLSLLSLHASVWFFVGGCVCTLVLYEITKPWLKDRS